MKNRFILIPFSIAFSATCLSGTSFDEANARAKVDVAKASNSRWLTAMSDAMEASLGKNYVACIKSGQNGANADLSFVLDVMPDGHVANVWIASESPFANCLARRLKALTYPRPGEEGYFAVPNIRSVASIGT